MRGWTKLLLVLVLIALPVAGRWAWFYRGWYTPPVIPEIDESQIALPLSEYRPFAGEVLESVGRVVVDLSHDNNLEVDDLTPLRDHLTQRGVAIETFDGSSGSLRTQLRGATALVIIAPTSRYTAEERDAIADFVEDGGRLLLAADPTRPVPPEEEEESLDSALVPLRASAIPAINSLANAFGVAYFDDYLYNLVENEGNYRNVRFTVLSNEHSLTQGLEMVVFFAAHSLRSDGLSLVSGDENTLSSLRSGETGLTAAALAANGRVLALGDITALAPPYHTIADNDRFLSNIAHWLAAAERAWDLKDFPYLFEGPVALVQVGEGLLDPRLIARSGTLEEVFYQADLTLNLSAAAADHDTLFVGTFENVELVQEYLATAGVTITIVEAGEEEEAESAGKTETGEEAPGQATPTATLLPTEVAAQGAEDEETGTGTEEAAEEEPQGTVEIEGLGTIAIKGTTLFIVDRSANRVVVIALAEDGETAMEALERLASGDFSGCVHRDGVTVCSSGEAQEGLQVDAGGDESEQLPDVSVTPEGPPRIASRPETEAAFQAETPWLEALARESYDTTSRAGETYTYTIVMDHSQDVMWVYNWCTATKEQLTENWDNIRLIFTLDGEAVPLDSFVALEGNFGEQECRLYYTLLTDWPRGEHVLTTRVTFATTLDDGFDVYPAGTHVYRYQVYVAG
jgi:hypothetical protein